MLGLGFFLAFVAFLLMGLAIEGDAHARALRPDAWTGVEP